ncbi:phosphonoacetaldehyde hydrolase [Finegoldia magna]|uniref:phosphonoacetaldehyde hydrolase n=1 Tax=Finegoldia magna TaxID=1260 RepID=UPI000B9186B1|nr:phosphonoacetaldehyde hydrolase [Finegoldia magna]MDU2131281.1 phosphonoacetaldehyde hydrolase [Finegoldia magna]MDU2218820.1 phosphonoacetaldehyde hydrolase [Finegoldia magna]MDU4278084.1 phosphonoacetaldehyde hydrolase [Finegoldia magna]MDU5070601.1 phosphonoacetaldehyde hydrolase [Finegoldia magna]MDU6552075.1 phosphonoacetaldehyde hydrolase [Finegoldia magna]
MKNIEAIIFDWAGTTVDYGCMAPVKAFSEAFKEFGICPTKEEIREPMGMLKIDHIRTMLGMERINNLWESKYSRGWNEDDVKKVYNIMEKKTLKILSNYCDIKPNVIETVEKLRKKGIKIGSTTGYTTEMMNIVVPKAKENGYTPDFWITPNSVNDYGRPYPYMIFENIIKFEIKSVDKVIKVGDTVSDIQEGKNAGVISVGIIEGSSTMGYSKEEYNMLSKKEKLKERTRVEDVYREAGADYIINDISEVLNLI